LLILQSNVVQYMIKAVKLPARSQVPKPAALSEWNAERDYFKRKVCPIMLYNPTLSLSLCAIHCGGYCVECDLISPGVISSYI
jgi:hypothetical protein